MGRLAGSRLVYGNLIWAVIDIKPWFQLAL